MRAIIVILLTFGLLVSAIAQDALFSQYNASPMNLNPALTGFFSGHYRVVANFRSQWGSFVNPYRTASLSAEASLFKGKLKNDYLGIGLSFLNDKAGTIEFSTNQIGLSAAYKKNLGTHVKHGIALGIQAFFLQQNINREMLIFDDQYNGVEVDPNISSGESIGSNGVGSIDLGVGLLYQIIPNRYNNIYIGGSYYHILQPEISFIDNSTNYLKAKYIGHAGAKIDVTGLINLLPSVMYSRQASSYQANVGTYLQFILQEDLDFETSFSIGTWVRLANPAPDAIIIGARVDYMGFVMGLSYDLNISPLKIASETRGAYEISLIYTGIITTHSQRNMSIPCPQL